MSERPFEFTKEFITERCDFCGRCFSECPVLRLPEERATTEIQKIIRGEFSQVLDACTGCMACNTICPQNANPHTLIISRWGERCRSEGIPERARMVLPYQRHNLHETGQQFLTDREKELLCTWEENWRCPPECDTMMFAGCNMMLLPFMLDSPLYEELPIFGSLDLCCGEPFYRMGCRDTARSAALNVQHEFKRMGVKKVVVPCLACYHLFTRVYPHILDVPLGVEVVSLEAWLCDRLRNGALRVSPLNRTAVLHDNCWPKASGDRLFNEARELLDRIGVTVTEAPHARENALCCGMCAGASRFRMGDIVRTAQRLLRELEESPAEWAVEYCGGCTWLLSLVNQIPGSNCAKPRYHVLELVRMAAGEKPERLTDPRMKQVIRAMAPGLLWHYAKGGRFYPGEIAGIPRHTQD